MKKLGIDSIIYSAGTLLNSALGLVFFVLVARALGPAQFGIVSVVIAISVVASDIFDFGMNTSMLKFLSEAEGHRKTELSRDFFSYKIFSTVLVVLLGLLVSPFLSQLLFKSTSFTMLTWQGFLAAGALIIYGYVNSNLQARKRFASSVVFNLTSNSIRLIVTGYFFFLGALNSNITMLAYLVPIYVMTAIWGYFDGDITLKPVFTKDIFLPIVKYGKWVAGSVAIASVSSRLDNLLLVRLANAFQTGIYTSVQRIFLAFNQIPAGISMVMVPDLSSKDKTRIDKAMMFGIGASVLISLGLAVFIFLAPWLVPFVFGTSFALSVGPSQILALGTMFFVLSVPFQSNILYTMAKSNYNFFVTLVKFIATVGLNLWLIPILQAQGAALSYAGVSLLGLIITFFLFLKKPAT